MAELMISKLKTIEKQIKRIIHSIELNEKKIPAAVTNRAITNCI
jgi:hypothetical protein